MKPEYSRMRGNGASSPAAKQFEKACAHWDSGEHGRAFRLFLLGAKSGDPSCQLNLGFFYDQGIGVRPDPEKALRWYKHAHRGGSTSAALNIGIVHRDQGRLAQAIRWFQRALERGNDDTGLQLAEVYLQAGEVRRARGCLKKVLRSSNVTEETRRKARRHLGKMVERRRE